MKKQVLAILLATLLILTTFAACGKKYLVYTDADGITHPVLTDAEGNTMLNEYGQIVVGVTEKNGKLVTDANGEYETRAILFPSSIANGNVFETPHFKMTVPEKQWYFEDTTLYKKDSEIRMDIIAMDDENTLTQQEESFDKQLPEMVAASEDRLSYTKESLTLQGGPTALRYRYTIKDESGSVQELREDILLATADGTVYRFLFIIPAAEADGVSVPDMLNMIKFR